MYSEATTLTAEVTDGEGTKTKVASNEVVNLNMYNRQKVNIEVEKKSYKVNVSGTTANEKTASLQLDKTVKANVGLYTWNGSEMIAVEGGKKEAGSGDEDSLSAKWEGLIYKTGSAPTEETAPEFYVCEDDVAGYSLDVAKSLSSGQEKKEIDGKIYLPVTIADVTNTKAIYNYEQLVPVVIEKKNYYTEGYESGSSVSVTSEGAAVTDGKNKDLQLTGVAIPDGGLVVYLEPGKSYTIEEKDMPAGFTYVKTEVDSVLGKEINLTDEVIDHNDEQNTPIKHVTIYNKNKPGIKVNKKDGDNDLAGAVFTLYKKEGGTYKKVLGADGNAITIAGNGDPVHVEAGTYYLAETTVPQNYLNPNIDNPNIRTEYGSGYIYATDETGTYYAFKEIKAEDLIWTADEQEDNITSFTISNISNKGSLTVQKYIDGSAKEASGFNIAIKNGSETVASGTTGGKGKKTFNNLPVYDSNGEKIVYTIEETGTYTNYYKDPSFENQTTTLTLGKTITKVNDVTDGEVLRIQNRTYTKATIGKVFGHTWQMPYLPDNEKYFASKDITTTIGLFKLDAENGVYKYVESKTVKDGTVEFTKLEQEVAYALVEMSCTNPYMYPYDVTTGNYLKYKSDTEDIPVIDINKYSVRLIGANTNTNTNRGNSNFTGTGSSGVLVNQDKWVQFDITKYLNNVPLGEQTSPFSKNINPTVDNATEYDNAVYALYKKVVSGTETALTFDAQTKDGWVYQGTYASGTAYSDVGNRMPGEFFTDVDEKVTDNTVYLLVEVDAGPGGATINPNYKYLLWKPEGTGYTVNISNDEPIVYNETSYPYVPIIAEYEVGINHYNLLNETDTGDGSNLIANIRISKWKDSYDEETGEPKKEYTPLPGVSFKVYLPKTGTEDALLETMTVGLDNTNPSLAQKAWAQGVAYQLESVSADGKTGTLIVYNGEGETGKTTYTNVPLAVNKETENGHVYGIEIYLKEIPGFMGETYKASVDKFPMLLCFVNKKNNEGKNISEVYNDAYFVQTSDANAPLAEGFSQTPARVVSTDDGTVYYSDNENPYRIVNYPTGNPLVYVRKFGYTPTEELLKKTGSELDKATIADKVPLADVEMYLQHYNGSTWENWNYKENKVTTVAAEYTFKTRADGSYLFAKGLKPGTYRIREKTDLTDYDKAYGIGYEREFTVDTEAVQISLYNPKKAKLTVVKKNLNGDTVSSAEFELRKEGTEEGTGTKNTTFTNISSGKYILSEVTAPDGLSSEYFVQYMESIGYTDLVNAGANIGYEYKTKSVEGGKDTYIEQIYLTNLEKEIVVKDPALVSFTLKKVNEDNHSEVLPGATFAVSYAPFAKWSMTDSDALDLPSGITSWTSLGNKTTDDDGLITFNNVDPGVYRFEETAAPAGFDIIKDKNGDPIYFYVVVDGGLTITVNADNTKTTIERIVEGVSKDVELTTTFINPAAEVEIENRPKVTASIEKTVETGDLELESAAFTFEIYDAITGGNKVAEATAVGGSGSSVTFKVPGTETEAKFSQYKTYYLYEVPVTNYQLVEVNGNAVTNAATRVPITFTTNGNLGISAKNDYMRGTVKFKKIDRDKKTPLSGATFAVYTYDTETGTIGTKITNIEWTKQGVSSDIVDGIYEADFYLADKESRWYAIKEVTAPEHYLPTDEILLTFELSAEHNVKDFTLENKSVENNEGWYIDVYKMDDLYGKEASAAGKEEAAFKLYHKEGTDWKPVSEQFIDDNGKARWLTVPGETYAVAETWHSNAFIGLDSVHDKAGNEIESIETVDGYPIFVIDAISEDIVYEAYNKPAETIKITKLDVGGYPTNAQPGAYFSIYELDKGLGEYESLEAAIEGKTLVYESFTKTQASDTKTSYDVWDACEYDKNYVIVETSVFDYQSDDYYNTLNKDDERVQWYVEIPALSKKPTEQREFELKNIYSDATFSLTKSSDVDTAAGEELDSLLSGSRDVVYTITPSVDSNNQPLKTFTLEDTGLTFENDISTEYGFTKIEIGQATHDPSHFVEGKVEGDSAKVTAKLTVKYADETSDTKEGLLVSDSSQTYTATEEEIAKRITSFSIEYYSEGVRLLTADSEGNYKYSLGQDFTPGVVKVTAHLEQLPESAEHPATEVTAFTNASSLTYAYPKWPDDGSAPATVTHTIDAETTVTVASIKYPRVKIEKSSVPDNAVSVGQEVTYTIKITNLFVEGQNENFVNPVVLDMLPTGVTFIAGTEEVGTGTKGETFSLTTERYTGEPTYKYDPEDENSDTYGDAETGVVFRLTGSLNPSSSVTITFKAKVQDSAVIYGDGITNYVYLSSSKQAYHVEGTNPKAYSFQNEGGSFPGTLPNVVKDSIEIQREGGLSDVLGDYDKEDSQYIWVKSSSGLTVNAQSGVTLVKSIKGDKDAGYSSVGSFIASSTRTNTTGGKETFGHVDFRLSAYNSTGEALYNLVIGDVVPAPGDKTGTSRKSDSAWSVIFDEITGVMVGGEACDKYTLYYYTSPNPDEITRSESTANAALNVALDVNTKWADNKAWPQGAALPDGWHKASDVTDKKSIAAFLIVFDNTVKLPVDGQILITYHTTTEDIKEDSDFQKVQFENANNTFKMNWAGAYKVQESNLVKVSLMDKNVSVEGDLWIDEDWDGKQNPDGGKDYASKYKIIEKFRDALTFGITDNRTSATSNPSITTENTTGKQPGGKGIGESIKHFTVSDLNAAFYVEGRELYVNELLNTKALKTDDPFNYSLTATLKDEDKYLLEIFELTDTGNNSYKSDDPDKVSTKDSEEYNNALDNNFSGSDGQYTAKPFYLRYSENIDKSKDIGFKMVRDLKITKVANDDPTNKVKVSGAEFKLYGPYDEGKGKDYNNESDKSVVLPKTNEDGVTEIKGLNFLKEYVIEEVSAGTGYVLDGANAEGILGTDGLIGTILEPIEGKAAWVLKLPAYTKEIKEDEVIVRNVRKVEVKPEVEKLVEVLGNGDYTLAADAFTFTIAAVEPTDAPLPASVTAGNEAGEYVADSDPKQYKAAVKFDSITINTPGTYKYKITENKGSIAGMTYSEITVDYTVDVKWDADNNQLVATETYKTGDESNKVFTNTYKPEPVILIIPVKKEITGGFERPVERTFTFTLDKVNDEPMPAGTGNKVTVTGPTQGSFGEITFATAGTYKYTVTEDELPDTDEYHGYDITTKTVNVVVEVVDDTSNGKLVVSNADEILATLENSYKPDPVKATVSALKAIETEHVLPVNKEFTFTLAKVNDEPMPEGTGNVVTVEGAVKGTFGEIEFTKVGTYEYTVTETEGSDAGYTYATTPHKVVFTVTDTNGKLGWTATVDGVDATEAVVDITNTYKPEPVELTLPVCKFFDENSNVRNSKYYKTFTFKIAKGEGTPAFTPMPATDTVTVEETADPATLVGAFDTITFKTASTYKYVVTEVDDDKDGYTYDEKTYHVTVTVTDPDDVNAGNLQVEWTAKEKLEGEGADKKMFFTNLYKPATISQAFKVKKTITGNPRVEKYEEEFEFILDATYPADAPMPSEPTVKIKDEGEAVFGDIVYEKAGTYTYKLVENYGQDSRYPYTTDPHYTYSTDEYQFVVTVTDNDGHLEAKTVIQKKQADGSFATVTDADDKPAEKAEFINNYDPTETHVVLTVSKAVKGNARPKNKTFSFKLSAADEAPMPVGTGKDVVTIEDEGTAYFDSIEYHYAGTYTYEVEEILATSAEPYHGYEYSEDIFKFIVVVTDNDGVLEAVTYLGSEAAENIGETPVFTNIYTPDPVTISVPVKKTVTGPVPEGNDKTFTFVLATASDAPKAPITEERVITITGNGEADFGEIKFTEVGEYKYSVTETFGGETGYTYDTTEHYFYVTVVDEEGVLKASVKNDDGDKTQITNVYKPLVATASWAATKKLDTENERPVEKEFRFILTATGSTAAYTKELSVFDAKTTEESALPEFTAVGTYEYEIREVDDGYHSYTFDETVHTLKFEVIDDDGQLKFTTILDGEKIDENAVIGRLVGVDFTNKYKPVPATASFAVKKAFTATSSERVNPKTFTFALKASESTYPMPEGAEEGVKTATASEAVKADFGDIVFEKAGEYHYTVYEVDTKFNGYTYDTKVYDIIITVTDDDGTLYIDYALDKDIKAEKEQTVEDTYDFTNGYDVLPNSVSIDVTKKFNDVERPDRYKTGFTFILKPLDEAYPMPADDKIVVYDDGTTEFKPITFTKVGTYEYELSEVDDGEEGYTYDTSVKHIVITVTDVDSELKAYCEIDGVHTTSTEFTNKFVGASDLVIKKTVEGIKSKTDFGFEVKLLHKDGTPYDGTLPAVKEKADGTIENVTLSFNAEGVAQFTLNDKEVLTISDLVIGTKYFVTETETLKYEMTCENTNGVIAKTNEPATFLNKKHENHVEPSGGGGGGGGKPTTTPATLPDPPGAPTGEPRHPSASYTPQDPLTQNILGASEDFRNNLVLAANNFRNNLVLGANGSRVFTGDTSNILLYLILLLVSGFGLTGAAVLVKRRKKEDEE